MFFLIVVIYFNVLFELWFVVFECVVVLIHRLCLYLSFTFKILIKILMSHHQPRRWVTRQEHDRRRRVKEEAAAFVEAVNDLPCWELVEPLPERELILSYQPLFFRCVYLGHRVEQYFRPLKGTAPNLHFLLEVRHKYKRRKYIYIYLCKVFIFDIAERVTQFVFVEDPNWWHLYFDFVVVFLFGYDLINLF